MCICANAQAPDLINQIQQNTLQDSKFNKGYYKSGCFIRAHWIAYLIHQAGHKPVKIFIKTESPKIRMKILLPTEQEANWQFHVTAGYQDLKGQIWLVDPLLSNQPFLMEDWVQFMQVQNPHLKLLVQVTGPEVYHINQVENLEFLSLGSTFSKNTMDFIFESMEDLFNWEAATLADHFN